MIESRTLQRRILRGLCGLCVVGVANVAAAQNWELDARKIALGTAGSANLASDMIEVDRPYRSIVLPFGLLQVLRDFDIYNPESSRFDPVRAFEHAASPLHYIVHRDPENGSEQAFVSAIRNGAVSRDLNAYTGFAPTTHLDVGGVAAPNWGYTIAIASGDRSKHGAYVGAGPYLSLTTASDIDPRLAALLSSSTPTTIPNARLTVANASQLQTAAAIISGYRGHFAWPGSSLSVDGVYLAVNYNYLIGIRYDADALQLRLDTDAAGLLTLIPGTTPLTTSRVSSGSGRGRAVDVGVGVVRGPLTVAVGVNRIANRMDWSGATETRFTLGSVLSGGATFVESPDVPIGDVRVSLPLDRRVSTVYTGAPVTVLAEFGSGIGGRSFHAGVERRVRDNLALRAGVRYALEQWNPSGGMGIDLSPRVALDVAAFGTGANIERRRLLGIAVSIRINRPIRLITL
jgi:hypothetical protein